MRLNTRFDPDPSRGDPRPVVIVIPNVDLDQLERTHQRALEGDEVAAQELLYVRRAFAKSMKAPS